MYSTKFRRLPTVIMCVLLAVMLALGTAAAYPTHEDFISDPDSILSATTVDTIKSANKTLMKTREVQIAVCITDSIGDAATLRDFGRALFTEWEMGDGVLLVVRLDDTPNYCSVQSVNVDDVLTNLVLSSLMTENMEADFNEGNIDRGVMKYITALTQYMTANLPDPNAAVEEVVETDEAGNPVEEEPSGFVKFMRGVLWLLLILFVLVVAVFILAMYNEDVGDFVRTYVFRRNAPQPPPYTEYYDDRLYGNPKNPPAPNPRNPYNPYGQNAQYSRERQYGQNGQQPRRQPGYDPYNDYDMQYRQPRSYQGQQQGYGQQQPRRRQQPRGGGYGPQGYPLQGNPRPNRDQYSGQRRPDPRNSAGGRGSSGRY